MEYEVKRPIRITIVTSAVMLLSACANLSAGNLFSHYSAQNNGVYSAVKSGQYDEAEQKLPEYIAGDILDNMEKGRVYFLNEHYPQSKSSLELSDSAVRVQQDKAVISVSDTATSVGSIAVNDNLNTYSPADYELGFLHLYLGLNYLQSNSLEGALVEMRRANQVQERARKDRERELESAQASLKKQGVSPNLGSVLSNYPDAGKTLQAVQNGYLLYLSALLYETSNDLNSAYVDYRRALAVEPDNAEIIDGTMRVAKRLGMNQDLEKLKKRYGDVNSLDSGKSRVIVIDEQGVVEALSAWKLSLPVYDSRGDGALYSLALPYYRSDASERFRALQLNDDALSSDQLTNVNLMAQRDLSERMPTIVIRQTLRVLAKDQMRKETAKGDDVGNLLFNVWNTLTEQADTRSWQTLPGKVYSASAQVNAGEQTLNVDGKDYTFNVEQNRTVLVWVSRQGNNSTVWHKQLGKL
ncbi:COG3014 family protein [Vibrio paucivorans]